MAVAFLLVGCSNNGEKQAAQCLQQAEQALLAGQYSEAKSFIDSIRICYPKAFEARRKGISLMQQIDLQEQQRNLVYLDSLMTVKQAQLDSIVGTFVLEKDTAYQEIGNYFYPTQTVEKNVGRSFLRAQVNELGEMSLTSIYCAGGNIHHSAVKVSVGDEFAETNLSTDSYETTDLGRVIEKADYKLSQDGGVSAFVASHADKNIQLEFVGDRNYKTAMPKNDRIAITQIGNLARILAAMESIRQEQKEANLKIQFVKKKMEEKE